jgi:hypothetical protein
MICDIKFQNKKEKNNFLSRIRSLKTAKSVKSYTKELKS